MIGLTVLTKTISQLQQYIKSSDAKSAAYAAQILRAIKNKDADTILKQEQDNLIKYVDIYRKYSGFNLPDLKAELDNINKYPAIDILIILHLINSYSKPTKIVWPTQRRIITRDNYDYARDYFLDRLDTRIPTRTHNPSIVEYAERTTIATGVYRGLKFNHDRAPYLKRPMWCLSPESPFREVIMMFPAQSGKTFTANIMAMYYIEAVPSEIIYATSNETMAMQWLEKEIEPRAMQAGIIFKSETENKKSRRTGDTSYRKSFPGGDINIASARSPSQLASATKRIIFGDELDRWQIKIGEQGSTLNQLRARGQAWGLQQKILWFSTPISEMESTIYILYLQGDQELYYVPCPYCGTMQLMDFEEDRGFGIVWEMKNNRIYKKSIQLICENKNCGRGIKESGKPRMLVDGEWRPSALAEYEYMVSFHLNGLYSFQLSWYDMVISYVQAKNNAVAKQDFDQLKMGRPHKGSGARPRWEKLFERRGNYKSGEVPPGVLYIVIGVDVQRGSKTDHDNPARLEMQALGIGAMHRTWSLDYKVFFGDTSIPFEGAWKRFVDYMDQIGFGYTRIIDNFWFPVRMIFIDSSDGDRMSVVYNFCEQARWQNIHPIKGQKDFQRAIKNTPDVMTDRSAILWSRSKDENMLINIATAPYKTTIYNCLNEVNRLPTNPQPYGFIDFPRDYPERYFEMLTAEDKMADGSFQNHSRRNEALDNFVYALCAADVWLADEVERHKLNALQRKLPCRIWPNLKIMHRGDLSKITKRYAIDWLIAETDPKKLYQHFNQ